MRSSQNQTIDHSLPCAGVDRGYFQVSSMVFSALHVERCRRDVIKGSGMVQ